MQKAFSTFGQGERVSAGKEGVNILRITSTCTSTCALHVKPRFDWEDDFNFIVYVIHTINFDIP